MAGVLIVCPAWVGDMVMVESLVAALHRENPLMEIDLLAPSWTAPLGERMNGVSATRYADFVHGRFDLWKRIKIGRELSRARYDLAIILANTLKSAVAPVAAGIPTRRGYVGEMRYGLVNDIRRLDKERLPRTIDRFVALGNEDNGGAPEVSWPRLGVDAENRILTVRNLGLSGETRPVIALCPGAEYGPAKQWPASHFAELARRMIDLDFAVWIFGSAKDGAFADEIADLGSTANPARAPVNLCGKTSLLQAVDLLSLSAAVVTNDSGLMHVAAALQRPIVALYGSTTPAMTPPLAADVRILQRNLSCRPCFERVCPLNHLNCLRTITPDEAAEAVLEVMSGR
jgi:heptosyltransferase-2